MSESHGKYLVERHRSQVEKTQNYYYPFFIEEDTESHGKYLVERKRSQVEKTQNYYYPFL